MSETVTYPLDRESAGTAFWKVFFSYAASYPENPTPEDKKKFKTWFIDTLKSFPCSACKQHSKEYIMKQPPDTRSREKLFDWMCKFENHVREGQGKEPLLCQLSEHEQGKSSSSCPSCSIDRKDVKASFKDLKDVSRRIFEELCHREKVPVPEILFAPCPSAPITSCTQMEKDLITGKIKQDKSVVYLNPEAYSPRTIYHEFIHYAMYHKKRDDIASDEWEVERIAQEMMKKEFPYDVPKAQEKPLLVVKDTSSYLSNPSIQNSLKKNYLDEATSRIESEFPMYAKLKHMQEEKEIQAQQASESGGVLSLFDSLYQPFEEPFGLKARALNEMHTSNILASTATTLMQSNLSPFGSMVASLATGLGLLGVGIMGKKNLSTGDRRFLSTMGAYFLWNNIGYSNPKLSNEVITDGKTAIESAKALNFDTIKDLMLESPEKKALASQSQALVQAQTQARRGQRGSRSGGTRGPTGVRSGRRVGVSARPDILRRVEQRQAGLPEPPDVSKYRDFPTRFAQRRLGEFTTGEGAEIGEGTPTSNTLPFWGGNYEEGYEEGYDEFGDLV